MTPSMPYESVPVSAQHTAEPPSRGTGGDPMMIGLPSFVVGSVASASSLIGYVPLRGRRVARRHHRRDGHRPADRGRLGRAVARAPWPVCSHLLGIWLSYALLVLA